VGWPQIFFGGLLVLGLLVLALPNVLRQLRTLRSLGQTPDAPADEVRYERDKARRRLLSSALLIVLACQLAGALVFLEEPAERHGNEWQAEVERPRAEAEPGPERTPELKGFVRLYTWYWIAFLVVLLAVLMVAWLDLWAIRTYARQQHRRIQADRRAMIEHQIEQMRAERNGHG
jgi:hypothetical protein